MAGIQVVKATQDDIERCAAALLLAFSNDPFVRWMFPEPESYLTCFGAMLRLFAGTAIESGSAYVAEDSRAAAIWLPPGAQTDRGAIDALMQAGIAAERKQEVFGMLSLMGGSHPDQDHYYLQLLGADPACQGMGYGTALLERSLLAVDEAHLPAFLVSSNARNQPLYERFDFRVTQAIQSGSSPSVWPMLREAR
ncbi:MAG TPA: GNAT family N-acetyltransferase [Dehalococcoidia bacterium]|nr:GNAT family N-acetyltransferase [Dehalococcoidia bacterium]